MDIKLACYFSKTMRTLPKILFFTLYLLLLLAVTGKLFFEKQFNQAIDYLFRSGGGESKTVTIGFSESPISLKPLTNDTASRARLLHLYEPLVRRTPDLQIEPALAISYGALDPVTWEFRLRPGVKFTNGSLLTLDDVFFSLEEAKKNPASGVKDLAATIKEIKKMPAPGETSNADQNVFQIITHAPDPLLPSKLSFLLIFQKGTEVGTGPYAIEKSDANELHLKRFSEYWGQVPEATTVILKTLLTKEAKIAAIRDRMVDILANVPPDTASNFYFPGFTLAEKPTTEVNFFLFNFTSVFKEKSLREAVKRGLNIEQLSGLTQGFTTPASQFVANGVFGFDPTIKPLSYDPEKARAAVREFTKSEALLKITLDMPAGLDIFASKVKEQLKQAGFELTVNFLKPQDLERKITKRTSPFFFFGWRTELGDSADFLRAVVHSQTKDAGQFNGGNFKNEKVDALIDEADKTVDVARRLSLLREAMKIITEEDIIGIPLFSPEVLYGLSNRIKWQPRVDGYILAHEVKL